MCMHKKGKAAGKCLKDTMPKLWAANLQGQEKPTLRECVFSPSENPGINAIKAAAFWLMANTPDIMGWTDWKIWPRRIGILAIIFFFSGLTIQQGYTLQAIVANGIMAGFCMAAICANYLGLIVYGFLDTWENFS